MTAAGSMERLERLADSWGVVIESVRRTASSLLAFGVRADQPVVLKVTDAAGDEASVGRVAAAFHGEGMVRVLEHETGAALFERLTPGTPLAELVAQGDDVAATRVLAEVTARLHRRRREAAGAPSVREWGRGFDSYLRGREGAIARALVEQARERWEALCATQGPVTLLHGDLQHYNVLADRERGWIAVDPKGVLGELEFELAAALRNPREVPEPYSTPSAVRRRVACFTERLAVDPGRVMEWAFAEAVLSAIWAVEDEGDVAPDDPALVLAGTLRGLVT